jgi:hypothetical protein
MQKPSLVGTTTADHVVQTRCRLVLMQCGFLETKVFKKQSETFNHRIGIGSAKRRISTANYRPYLATRQRLVPMAWSTDVILSSAALLHEV